MAGAKTPQGRRQSRRRSDLTVGESATSHVRTEVTRGLNTTPAKAVTSTQNRGRGTTPAIPAVAESETPVWSAAIAGVLPEGGGGPLVPRQALTAARIRRTTWRTVALGGRGAPAGGRGRAAPLQAARAVPLVQAAQTARRTSGERASESKAPSAGGNAQGSGGMSGAEDDAGKLRGAAVRIGTSAEQATPSRRVSLLCKPRQRFCTTKCPFTQPPIAARSDCPTGPGRSRRE